MPLPSLPSFHRSPRPDQPHDSPASISSFQFSTLHTNVRSMINGSSVYSNSPPPSNNNTPKIPFLGFLRRPQSPPNPIVVPDNDAPRDSSDSRSPLRSHHTAGSYIAAIAPLDTHPREPEAVYSSRHPADVPLEYGRSVDPETEQLQEEVHGRRRRRHRRRRKHREPRATHWVRRRKERGVCFSFMRSRATRGKCYACLISGLFLITVLTIYLSLALTRKSLGQEVHVLFIMVVLGTTIFFCHSLIRLCMLALHPEEEGPRIPSMTGPEGFKPIRPIRVHLARDEELGDADADASADEPQDEEKVKVLHPPPAYGLWRSSVRVDPNLLHWQRVENTTNPNPISSHTAPSSSHPNSRNGSVSEPAEPEHQTQGPRPPSYVSDDGVSYVVEAAPRSTAPSHTGVSDIHPAWRPGFAVSEVQMAERLEPRRL
ncbi:uncharacterized protein BDR25DRAFT_30049 [Lindgomyces ingoldianus]|uniref:Uncharacterized protein n=1 Tax=Lindgomyces ingoldianus TaxID=673940 RepID=A0ACB6QXZ1_9PLEO|nr:uncharacterized protein BDR25DRAFT_30049 [Lindgomyces ingoldianus]KAF2471066.1 hypothetical protein BDR25DRAFT_30049 [Lindgomyces ingoldianus]